MSPKLTLSVLQDRAIKRGGLLLSTEYKNNRSKLKWQCEKGHIWEASAECVKSCWCSVCANNKKTDLVTVQEYAKNKGGLLISIEYADNKQLLEWQCSEGHVWKASWNSVSSKNTWCPYCAGKIKHTLDMLISYAIGKGGKCLSTEYINHKQNIEWECKEGHKWFAPWGTVKDDHWCPYCAGKARQDIELLKAHAILNNGLLLSTAYKNNRQKLEWQCSKGHKWKAHWNTISTGHWCPECAAFKTETKCKEILEDKLNIPFKKTRFKFNNNRYEFDGYNEEHKVAFEYHGYQHYEFPNFYQKTIEQHNKAKQRDLEKVEYCLLNNIRLITIPYTAEKNLEAYIEDLVKNIQV